MLTDNFLSSANVVLEQNALVLNTGDKLVLFDTGMGSSTMFGPTTGKLLASLKAAGIDPKDIDAVVATHAHCDHVWGIMADDGKPNFPNAQIYLSQADFDYWTDEAKLSIKEPAFMKVFVEGARKNLLPVRDRDNVVDPVLDRTRCVLSARRAHRRNRRRPIDRQGLAEPAAAKFFALYVHNRVPGAQGQPQGHQGLERSDQGRRRRHHAQSQDLGWRALGLSRGMELRF